MLDTLYFFAYFPSLNSEMIIGYIPEDYTTRLLRNSNIAVANVRE
jgi:hypothetical protein